MENEREKGEYWLELGPKAVSRTGQETLNPMCTKVQGAFFGPCGVEEQASTSLCAREKGHDPASLAGPLCQG